MAQDNGTSAAALAEVAGGIAAVMGRVARDPGYAARFAAALSGGDRAAVGALAREAGVGGAELVPAAGAVKRVCFRVLGRRVCIDIPDPGDILTKK